MSRPKPQGMYKTLQVRVPAEWLAALEKHAASKHSNVTEIVRPHISKLVDAIVTLQDSERAA